MDTYRKPVANIAVAKIFLCTGICNFQRNGIGRIKIVKSVTMLKIVVDKYIALVSVQRAVVVGRFQILLPGSHRTMVKMVAIRYIVKQLQMQICTATNMDMFPFLFGTKILRYWRRIDNLTKNATG